MFESYDLFDLRISLHQLIRRRTISNNHAEDVGTVAMIEKTDVTALLIYQQHTKIGKVLTKKK
jgi:hypothetical protein